MFNISPNHILVIPLFTLTYIQGLSQQNHQPLCGNILSPKTEINYSILRTDWNDTLYIPVVVHTLYKEAIQNISPAQVASQLAATNSQLLESQQFPNGAGIPIKLQLAAYDPSGNPTSGINQVPTSVDEFAVNFAFPLDNAANTAMKSTSTGGYTAWPTDHYLNVWVCNLPDNIKGFATFPDQFATNLDGIVMNYTFFGTTGTGTTFPAYDEGKSFTHELGHWLNLQHIWGEGGCDSDDEVTDTPTQNTFYFGCPGYKQSCGSADMLNNFMQYTDDGCINAFTPGQKDRMYTTLLQSPSRQPFHNGALANLTGILNDQSGSPLPNHTVTLYTLGGSPIVSTNSDGFGVFALLYLPKGEYTLGVTDDTGSPLMLTTQSGSTSTMSDILNLKQGQQLQGISLETTPAVQIALGFISGNIWHDLDGNSSQSAGEPTQANMQVDLYKTNNSLLYSQYTDASGAYSFDDIEEGEYYIKISGTNDPIPSLYIGNTNQTNFQNTYGALTSGTISLSGGMEITNFNFGVHYCATIQSILWHDTDGDGMYDSQAEMGLNNVQVMVEKLNTQGNYEVYDVAYTQYDSYGGTVLDGVYAFCVPPGTYRLYSAGIPNMMETTYSQGFTDQTFQANYSSEFSLASAAIKADMMAGYYIPGMAVGQMLLINDVDDSTVPLSNVLVNMYDANSNFLSQTYTDANGNYTFPNLPIAEYYLEIDQVDYEFSSNDNVITHQNGYGTTSLFTISDNSVIDYTIQLHQTAVLALDEAVLTGQFVGGDILLTWQSTLTQNAKVSVEVLDFETMRFREIECSATQSASYRVPNADLGKTHYFRLSLDGNILSDVISVDTQIGNIESIVIPNLLSQNSLFQVSTMRDGYTALLVNANGQTLAHLNGQQLRDGYNLAGLSQGIYLLQLIKEDQLVKVERLIIY